MTFLQLNFLRCFGINLNCSTWETVGNQKMSLLRVQNLCTNRTCPKKKIWWAMLCTPKGEIKRSRFIWFLISGYFQNILLGYPFRVHRIIEKRFTRYGSNSFGGYTLMSVLRMNSMHMYMCSVSDFKRWYNCFFLSFVLNLHNSCSKNA